MTVLRQGGACRPSAAAVPWRRWPAAASVLLSAALTLRRAAAFDKEAHDAIGQTSASAMDQQAIRQVKRLLNGQDASDVAAWGHEVDDTYPDMAKLHFQVHDQQASDFCGSLEKRVAKCEGNICLLAAIKHFYGKVLKQEGRNIDFPAIDYNTVAKGIKFSDADSVKMLINLLGDLHQPMHLGFDADDMGRKVQLRFRGEVLSLYKFWDEKMTKIVSEEESSFWLGGWTHVRSVMDEFMADKEAWKKEGAFKMFEKWAEETIKFACATAYVHPTNGKVLAGPNANLAEVVDLSEEDYQVWKEKFLRQLMIAGERTAVVLNDVLDASSASKLHEGVGVKTNADKEMDKEKEKWEEERKERQKADGLDRRSRRQPAFVPAVLFKNLCIASVVVPLFLLVANHGLNPASWLALAKSLVDSAESAAQNAGQPGRPTKRFE